MALIGSINNYGSLRGEINDFGESLTGYVNNAGMLGGAVVGMRGLKGEKGETGDTGATGVGIASIAKTSSVGLVDTYTITYTNGNTATFTVTNGADGQASVVTASKVGDITTIYIDGVASATITDGQDGTNGQDGADGFSPIATVSKVGKIATITITDENGTTTAQISDGEDSADENVKQQYQSESGYTYWRPLVIGKSSNSTEGFTPTSVTDQTYAFKTLQVQPSTGFIRMGGASMFKGSYTHKLSPTTLTANRTATLPNKSGTIAFTDDIPPLVIDLGNIDPSDYEDDRDAFLNTLLDDGIYRFVWEDGDDYELYVVVESMLDSGYVYQKYWSSEEGSKYLYHCTLTVEDGEVVDRAEDTYMTLSDAINMFSAKTHAHYDSIDDAMSVFDWCDTNALTFDNAKPCILYTDTLNDQNWVIERYATVRQPKYRFIRVYDTSDASHFYMRSGSVIGNTTTWGSWEEYTVGGGSVNDVEVNGTSVVSGGVAEVTVPTDTSDLNNDSLFARGHTAIFHGTCSTAGGTGEKAVTCADFKASDLVVGAMILVTFSNANSSAVGDLALNVNSTGACPIKQNKAGTISNFDDKGYLKASTYPFVYDGTNWVTWYNTDTNTIGYNIRTNGGSLPVSGQTGRYRLLFTSADGTKFVPANTSSSTSATASKTVNQDKIDPFGAIKYYATTTVLSSGTKPSVSYQYQQYYTVGLGYSFNRTGSALTMTAWKPVYVKCTPQTDGSAIIDSTTPFVQDLPTTADGKIYIFLGIAISETNIDLMLSHPVYCYKNGHIQQYTNADTVVNVFIATYNVTSYSDILSAIASGKDVVCAYSVTSGAVTTTYYASLADYTNGASTEEIVFSATDGDTITTLKVNDQDVWSNTTTTVPSKTSDLNNDSGFITTSTFGDYITEYGESGNWQYQKYASGRIVMEGYYTFPSLSFSASGNVYRSTGNSFTIPNGVFTDTPTHGEAWIQGSDSVYISAIIGGLTTTGGKCQFVKTTSGNATNISAHIRIIQKGTIT